MVNHPGPLSPDVESGNRLTGLRALRKRLASDIDATSSARELASLAQRLMDVLAQIDEIAAEGVKPKETGLSDFEKRLRERERKSAAKTSRSAKGS